MMLFQIPTGDNVKLEHAYIWNNVRIDRDVVISQSVVCDNVEVKAGVRLNKQCVLAYNVSQLAGRRSKRNLRRSATSAVPPCYSRSGSLCCGPSARW